MQFIIKAIHERNDLFNMVYKFNHDISACVNSSRLEDIINPSLVKFLKANKRSHRRLNNWLEAKYDLKGKYFYNFEAQVSRLALIDSSALHQLMLYSGAAYFNDSISKVIKKSELDILKSVIGEDTYLFVLRRSTFVIPHKPDLQIENMEQKTLLELILEVGQKCLEICFSGLNDVVKRRVELKLSKHIALNLSEVYSDELIRDTWSYLRMILTKEVDRSLLSCFK